MKKKLSFSLMMFTLCISIFIGGCSCTKEKEPENPNAKVILANEIVLDKYVVRDATIGQTVSITYTINPSNTTDKTMLITSSDESVATIDKESVSGKQSDTITVTPVGVGTVNIIFSWSGTFDNNVENEDRTLTKATTIYVVGETGKETLNSPTNLTYNSGKFSWNKVSYGTDGVTAEPVYELALSGGASPTTPITLEENEYAFALTAGVTYTAKVKTKPTNELQNLYTASAYTEEIEVYKLLAPTSYTVNNGIVTWDKVLNANKYLVNVNGVDVETITANLSDDTISFDANSYFTTSVTELTVKVKALNDEDALIFDGDYSVNEAKIYQIGTTNNYALSMDNETLATTLSWDAVEHATNYTLEILKAGEVNPTVVENITTNSYVLDSSLFGTYNVRVKAFGDTNTLSGQFTDYYQFSTLDINDLTASLSNGVVTYSHSNLDGNKIVFTIYNSGENVTVTKTENGSFNVGDYVTNSSYIITARLVPGENSSYIVSGEKTIGQNYTLSLENTTDNKSLLVWDKISVATSYTLEIDNDLDLKTYENITGTDSKIKFELPSDLDVGSHIARVKVVTAEGLSNNFGEYFEFTLLDIDNLTASLSGGVVTYSATNLNGNNIVFNIINSGSDVKVVKTENGSFNVSDYVTTNSYIITAKLEGVASLGYASSKTKTIGQNYTLSLKNSSTNTTLICWDKLSNATSYTLEIKTGEDVSTFDNIISDANKVEYDVPSNLTAGAHSVRLKVVTNDNSTNEFGEYLDFTKLNADDISTTYSNNVFSASTTNPNINKIMVYVDGTTKSFTLNSGDEIDFTTIGLTRGEYTISVKAVSTTNTTFANSDTKQTSHNVEVISNPTISSVSKDGKLTWNTDSKYTNFVVYVDKGTENEQILNSNINEVEVTTLEEGEHTAYVVASVVNNILIDSSTTDFTFAKLGLVENVTLSNNQISWDALSNAGGYEIVDNGGSAVSVDSTTYTPSVINATNTYKIRAIGNGTNSVSGGEYEATFNKVGAVADLGVLNGKIDFTEENDVTYKMYVNDEEILAGKNYNFTGATPYEIQEVYVLAFRDGYFDSNKSNVLKVKKLGIATNIAVSSSDRETYTITWNAVTGANSYIVNYNNRNYIASTNSLQVVGELPGGTYQVKVTATFNGSDLITDASDTFGYVVGDASEPYSFSKLSVPKNILVEDGILTWENDSIAQVANYEIEYSNDDGDTWITRSLNDELSNDLSFLTGGTYLVKLRAVGNSTTIISSDFSSEVTVTKSAQVSGLKVRNGVITWDAVTSDTSAYVYDVYVYTKPDTDYILFGEPSINYEDTTYTIENIAENTEYYVKVVVKNSQGIEIYSDVSTALKVVKLNAPTGFAVADGVASWDAVKFNSVTATNDYRVKMTTSGQDPLYYDISSGILNYTIPSDISIKTSYYLSVMAHGTVDSAETMEGYLNSDYSNTREIYKLQSVSNLRIENGEIVWELTHSSGDKYLPDAFNLIFTKYVTDSEGNVVTHEFEDTIATNVTHYNMSDVEPGNYKLEFYVIGNGVITQNSVATVLGDAEKIRKLTTPTGLRMQNGYLVWNEADLNANVLYVLYNNGVEFLNKNYDDRKFAPTVKVTTAYQISIMATMEGAIYSEMSDSITIYQLPQVTNFTLDDGKFKWTAVENATGYTIVVSYKVQAKDDLGELLFDPETNEPIMVDQDEEIVVSGGNTTEISVPETLPQKYLVKEVYANGNTTSASTGIGYFNSIPINSSVNFTPLDVVSNLTVREGSFVWNKVTGADYYSIEILDSTSTVVKKVSTTTNAYTLTDDSLVGAGTYTLRITPISLSNEYLTTGIATETSFTKMAELTNVRIENGYVAWNVLKSDIVTAYSTDAGTGEGGEGGESGEGGEAEPKALAEEGAEEGSGEEGPTFTNDIFKAFYSVAVGNYVDDANTAKLYSLAYIKLKLTNTANNKVVTKTVQPFTVVDPGEDQNYVICYYFVDAEVDTWKISISAKGNTVHPEDATTIKFVDGVQQTSFLTATKLNTPLCPIHYDTTAIVDGKLVFTPVKLADGTLYNKYIIEAVPTNLPIEQIVTTVVTVSGENSQVFNVLDLGIKSDIPYNISIKTLGTESGTSGTLYLNSDTPMTTSLTILGRLSFTVTDGVVSWNSSSADYYILTIRSEDGSIDETHELQNNQTNYPLDENYPAGKYYMTIQAMGDGINKISSEVSGVLMVTKNDNLVDIALSNGEFIWANTNAELGYKVLIIKERNSETGEPVIETEEFSLTQNEEAEASNITFSLPDTCVSYYVGSDYNTYYYRFSIKVMKLGTPSGTGGLDLTLNGEYSEASYSYQRLNTPSNVRVNDGQIIWNDVAGANGYQVSISGNIDNGGTIEPVDQVVNVGSVLYYNLPNKFKPGVYYIKVRALGGTPDIATPQNGYITSIYSSMLTVVRCAEPNLRLDRGEVVWNSVANLPFEATSSVKLTINGNESIISGIENNIGVDFDTDTYPAGSYTISVQFIGNNELINGIPVVNGIAEDDESGGGDIGNVGQSYDFYYLSSNTVTRTFKKLETPSILLGKTVIDGEERNIIRWQGVEKALGYDVYVVYETTELVGEDDPETEEDDREEQTITHIDVFRYENHADFYGTLDDGGTIYNYFILQGIELEDYKVYIRAVGDGSYDEESETFDYGKYISSTRSNTLHIHIPIAPTNFRYDMVTGTLSWTNVTADSKIVLDVKKYNGTGYEEVVIGGIELDAGTTTYKLEEIGDYQVRIKSRLSIVGGDYDSDYSNTTLNISFSLFASGSGTSQNPYVITKEEELYNIRYFLNRTFTISNSIALNSYSNWDMIGDANNAFTGTLKGNGYTISNIKYTTEQNTNIAFIYEIANGATVENLKLNVTINSDLYSTRTEKYAGVAINNNGTISGCEVSGSVKVNANATLTTSFAGIVCNNYGTVTNTINKSSIYAERNTGATTYATKVAGIATINLGTITKTGNEGTLTGQDVGGIACYNYKEISSSYNTGSLNIVSSGYTNTNLKLGGIAAYNDTYTLTGDRGTIDTCYVIMIDNQITSNTSSGKASYIGGIVGNNNNSSENCISNCYALIGEYSVSSGDKVATLVGNVAGMSVATYYRVVTNCYSYSKKSTLFMAGSGNEITITNVTSANYAGRITNVSEYTSGTVSIAGMIITSETGYLPKFSWQ